MSECICKECKAKEKDCIANQKVDTTAVLHEKLAKAEKTIKVKDFRIKVNDETIAELSGKTGQLESQVVVMRKFISELRETICGTVDFALRTQKSCKSHCSYVEICLKCADLLAGEKYD